MIPSQLKPNGVLQSDGKRLDGISLVPWKCGRSLVWTCPDTYAPSHLALASVETGSVASVETGSVASVETGSVASVETGSVASVEAGSVASVETGSV